MDWDYFNLLLENKLNLTITLKTIIYSPRLFKMLHGQAHPLLKENSKDLINYLKKIKDTITEINRLRRIWHQIRAPFDKTKLNRLNQQLTREIKDLSINKFLSNLTSDGSKDYSFWKVTKHLKKPINEASPTRKSNGIWARSNSDKADVFAEHRESGFLPNEGQNMLTLMRTMIKFH